MLYYLFSITLAELVSYKVDFWGIKGDKIY